MSSLESFIKLSQDNSGAMHCVAQLVSSKQDLHTGANPEKRREILRYIDQHHILGDRLAVLYSEICEENLDLMHYIIINASVEEVKLATSKRNYSGRDILINWLLSYELYH